MMVLPLIMKTEKNFKQEKKLKFTQLCNFQRALEKISEAGDFLSNFLRFWGFEAHFLTKLY